MGLDMHGHPDGMKTDIHGNVFCSGPGGIWVIDPAGTQLGIIIVPDPKLPLIEVYNKAGLLCGGQVFDTERAVRAVVVEAFRRIDKSDWLASDIKKLANEIEAGRVTL